MSDAKGDLGRDFLVAKAKHLRDQLAAATARAEKAERERDYARGEIQRMTGCRPDDVLAADRAYREKLDEMQAQRDALRAENEGLTARVGVLRGVLASWMGHAMHSQEERKQAEAALSDPDKAAAERDARLAAEVKQKVRAAFHASLRGEPSTTNTTCLALLEEHDARIRDEALREAVRELERHAQGWRNARTSSEHTEETADGYEAAAVVVQALLGKAGAT